VNRIIIPTCLNILLFTLLGCSPKVEQTAFISAPQRISSIIDEYVDNGGYPLLYMRMEDKDGTLLYEHGKVNQVIHQGGQVDGESLFRIWSMSKIVTISVALDLIEEGVLNFDDQVIKYIPEFKDLKVAVDEQGISLSQSEAECASQYVAVSEPMTVLHLLNHEAGFYYATTGKNCIDSLAAEQNIATSLTSDELIARMAELPLIQQPGTVDFYGTNTTVLGLVAERATGKSLQTLVEKHLTTPLKIEDLTYLLPEGETTFPSVTGRDSILRHARPGELDIFGPDVPDYIPGIYLGGEGMLASSDAYCDFLRMLLNYGESGGVRILETATVEDLISPHTQTDSPWGHNGYNIWITGDTMETLGYGPAGLWQGGGYEGTNFWVDPENEFVAVIMSQINETSSAGWEMYNDVRAELYKQIEAAD
jgi:CubicO group peptidase (beta-lactamase class C family)